MKPYRCCWQWPMACVALLACIAPECLAEGKLFLAGTELRTNGERFAYAGALIPLPGDNRLGKGWVQRYWLDGNRYAYDVSNRGLYGVDSTRIEATAVSAEAALGYHVTRGDLRLAGYAGVRYTDTALSPDDPGSRVRGTKLWPKVQFELSAPISRKWESRNIAAWVFGLQGYWLRSRLVYRTNGGLELGPEVIAAGDQDYSALKAGFVVGALQPLPSVTLSLRAGYHFQKAANSPYVGLDLSIPF